jgi:truncated hemoglobin YjbI
VLLTTVLVVVLVVIGIAAVVTVPLMIRSTRRQLAPSGSSAAAPGMRKPIMGSPAQVWVSRGERVLRELGATLGEHTALHGVSADAAGVVAELRLTASQVAELDHALARIPVPSLEQERDDLAARLAESAGHPAEADLARTHEAVSARIAAARRQHDQRDALLAKMQATVTELEQARDELTELIGGTVVVTDGSTDTATAQLTGRLDALRQGLVEVRAATNPEIGPGGQG